MDKRLVVANKDIATIDGISPDGEISARLTDRRLVTFSSRDNPHFDHGYAVTSHSSQGLTAHRVLVNVDTDVHPELLNNRFAYVSISRASHDAQVFTNDAAKLSEALSREVTKASALDSGKSLSQVASDPLGHTASVKSTPGRGLGLGL